MENKSSKVASLVRSICGVIDETTKQQEIAKYTQTGNIIILANNTDMPLIMITSNNGQVQVNSTTGQRTHKVECEISLDAIMVILSVMLGQKIAIVIDTQS